MGDMADMINSDYDPAYYADDRDEWVELEGIQTLHQTDKAILVSDGDVEGWIPLSQCDEWPDKGLINTGTLVAKRWILEVKGFI